LGTLGDHSGELARALDNLGVASEGTARLIADNRPGLDTTIAQLRTILAELMEHKTELDEGLRNLPETTQALSRVTTYGKWVNLNGVCINGTCGAGFSSDDRTTSAKSLRSIFFAAASEPKRSR
jgi:ABC-type transporter Mla subunit MlaD